MAAELPSLLVLTYTYHPTKQLNVCISLPRSFQVINQKSHVIMSPVGCLTYKVTNRKSHVKKSPGSRQRGNMTFDLICHKSKDTRQNVSWKPTRDFWRVTFGKGHFDVCLSTYDLEANRAHFDLWLSTCDLVADSGSGHLDVWLSTHDLEADRRHFDLWLSSCDLEADIGHFDVRLSTCEPTGDIMTRLGSRQGTFRLVTLDLEADRGHFDLWLSTWKPTADILTCDFRFITCPVSAPILKWYTGD